MDNNPNSDRIAFLKEQLEELGNMNPHNSEEATYIFKLKQDIRKELKEYGE